MANRAWMWGWLLLAPVLVLSGCDRSDSPEAPQPEPVAPESEAASAADREAYREAGGESDGDGEAGSVSDGEPTSLPVVELADLEALIAETAERDQVLVLDFWATWCAPCVAMFPELHSGLKAMGDDVRSVTVTLDDASAEAKAIAFLAEHDALSDAYALVRDSDKQLEMVEGIGERWTDLVVPAILVYDRDGELAGEFIDDSRVPPILERVRELVEADQADGAADADVHRAHAHHAH